MLWSGGISRAYLFLQLPEIGFVEFLRVGHHLAGMDFPEHSQQLIDFTEDCRDRHREQKVFQAVEHFTPII